MEHSLWDDIPLVRVADNGNGDALEGTTIIEHGGEFILLHANGREIARAKDRTLLEDYRDQRTSAKTASWEDDAVGGPGFYVVDTNNDSVMDGPFDSREEAMSHAAPLADGGMAGGLSVKQKTAAKPKGNRAPDEPVQQPMRPVQQIRNSPSADQLKARKQMARKQASNKESAMRTEAQILREMAVASLADQRTLAEELDTLRHQRSASLQADRDVDLADTIVRAHLTPVRVHAMHTTATDWVDTEEEQGDPTLAMKTEATLWFQRTSAEVRDDLDEFAIQAQGQATRLASRHGEQADAAFEAFIGHVDHLYRQASKVAADADPSGQAQSGLPTAEKNGDEDPYLSEDWDDKETGVHPDMPGAGGQSSTSTRKTAFQYQGEEYGTGVVGEAGTVGASGAIDCEVCGDPVGSSGWEEAYVSPWDTPGGQKAIHRHCGNDVQGASTYASKTAADGQSCADCGASIEHDPAGEDPSTWHHNDGDSHDHEATPKSASKTAADDVEWVEGTAPSGATYFKATKDGYNLDVRPLRDGEGTPGNWGWSVTGDGANGPRNKHGQAANRSDAERIAFGIVKDQQGFTMETSLQTEADAVTIDPNRDKSGDSAQGESSLDDVEVGDENDKPMWDWELDRNKPGTGAADVKDAKNPNDHTSRLDNSMLDKAAAFRATVAANLAKD